MQEEAKPLHFGVTALAKEKDLSAYTSFQPVSFTTMNFDMEADMCYFLGCGFYIVHFGLIVQPFSGSN